MNITYQIKMDLADRGVTERVDVVQADKCSRSLELALYAKGAEWQIPSGATAVVRFYNEKNGTGGNYETLPDGSPAYTIRGNVLTVVLAPQVCAAPGPVGLAVGLIADSREINTFVVAIDVQRNPGISAHSENYYKIAGSIADTGWTPNRYLGTDGDGKVVAVEGDPGGMTAAVKTRILTLLKNAVYVSDQSVNITALEAALASGGDGTVTGNIMVSDGVMTIS